MKFEVAHGQLDEKQLEERMLRFLRGEADVLVATSIIESGIDIPQANTLIVERADLFGLAQLYQIRSEEHTSELQSRQYLVCRLLLEKKKYRRIMSTRFMTIIKLSR